jgi:hypothetical protein
VCVYEQEVCAYEQEVCVYEQEVCVYEQHLHGLVLGVGRRPDGGERTLNDKQTEKQK